MARIIGVNYAREQWAFAAGDVVENSNLSQAEPSTVMKACAGVPITFKNCNLVNVAVD